MNSISLEFDRYIMDNRISLRNKYIEVSKYRISSLRGEVYEERITVSPDIIKSWSTIVSTYFDELNLSHEFIDKLCLYCEVLKVYQEQRALNDEMHGIVRGNFKPITDYISEELIAIRKELLSKKVRSKIVDKYYNYTNGRVEYLLENGEYVEIKEPIVRPVTHLDMSVLPIELLSILDDNEYRNKKIDQII